MAKIAFVQNLSFEYLGIMYLSAVLKEHGHSVEVFIVSGKEEKEIEKIKIFKPDIVGFSCTTGGHVWALSFARKIKNAIDCLTIMGGPHPTFFPEIVAEPGLDVICRGEGEHALLELAEGVDAQKDHTGVLNCWFSIQGETIQNEQRPLIAELDTLPFPDRYLYVPKYPHLKRSQKVFIGGRGCPFECTFCFNHVYKQLYKGKGQVVRYRSVDNLLLEIKQVLSDHEVRTIYFQDDTFILNKKWIAEFAKRYKDEIDLPFVCLVRADLVDDITIKRLAEAGCENVFFGVETGNEELRQVLLKKRVSDAEIKESARILKKYGIRFRTYNIFGLPGESLENAFETVSLNVAIGTDYPWSSLFYPFPGTVLAKYAHDHGYLRGEESDLQPSFFTKSFVVSKDENAIKNLHKLFFYCVKFPILFPFIKKIIQFKTNFLYDWAFLFGYSWCYLRSENLTITEMISVGFRNVGTFFFSRK